MVAAGGGNGGNRAPKPGSFGTNLNDKREKRNILLVKIITVTFLALICM